MPSGDCLCKMPSELTWESAVVYWPFQHFTFNTAALSSWNSLSARPQWHHTLNFLFEFLTLLSFCGYLLCSISKWRSSPGLGTGPLLLFHLHSPKRTLLYATVLITIITLYSLSPQAKLTPHLSVCVRCFSSLNNPFLSCLPPQPHLCKSDSVMSFSYHLTFSIFKLLSVPSDKWDHSFLTRNRACPPWQKGRFFATGPPGKPLR